ncbi:unnamed protein product [Dovyalis caffra]|uniref:Uncharacterized protein n=1 Tax=Dovyalis caffra TaxID=77055 RepID=A0AAV1S3D5_9ROSI|nr:unnamed protein product [Dovyalis caffra]
MELPFSWDNTASTRVGYKSPASNLSKRIVKARPDASFSWIIKDIESRVRCGVDRNHMEDETSQDHHKSSIQEKPSAFRRNGPGSRIQGIQKL